MFLWLTSPAPATYGGGSHVMFSPQFYTVSPEDSSGRRNFIPNSPGRPINMFLRAMELGPHGLPIVMARTGQIVEVPHEIPGQKPPSIRLANGRLIPGTQVQSVRKTEQGTLELLDARGKLLAPKVLKLAPIVRQRALLSADRPVPVVPMRAFTSAIQARKLVIKGIPIFLDPAGNVIDVEPGQADSGVLISQNVEVPHEIPGQKPPSIRLANGRLIPGTQVQSVRKTEQGTLELLDARGKLLAPKVLKLAPIVRQRALLSADRPVPVVPMRAFTSAIQARKLVIKGIPIFLDPAGNVIDVEPGQADSGVLISQNGSLIYYIIAVNDVFAFHRTMQGAAVIPPNTNIAFPTSMADVNAVVSFAASKGHTIQDPKALAIETKSSWMDASKVPNPNDYIQVEAVVPTFDKSNPNNWVPNGQTTLKLVMLGLHVVGSTSGHGEMVWGTFEHQGNAPNATYAYNSTSGLKTLAQNTSGNWLFTPSGSSGPFNATNNSWTGTAITGTPVGPSPVLRAKPWGSNDGGNPANAAGLNTQVISANASVISQLNAADVRRQYFQLGTKWTIFGAPPNGGNEVGTNHLANATMETFAQGTTPSAPSANCFSCHTTNKVPVSHVYPRLTPLP